MFIGIRCAAIIAAAGMGKRMGAEISKQFLRIGNMTVLEKTLRAVLECEYIDEILIVIKREDEAFIKKEVLSKINTEKNISFVYGGVERQDSVRNALKSLPESIDIVISHDGARPFVKKDLLELSIQTAAAYGACCTGVPVKDTIKFVAEDMRVSDTPNRSRLWQAQTPQAFRKDIIIKAYDRAYEEGLYGTDDCQLVEVNGGKVRMIMGDYSNIKLTTPEDMIFAEMFLEENKR